MKSVSVKLIFEKIETVAHIPGTWPVTDYRKLLELLDIDDIDSIADGDVEEMALMALQDLEAEEAMRVVLTNFAGDQFTRGQVQNLCEELKEPCAWEEYAEIDHQRNLYVCVEILHRAFPHDYLEPAVCAARLSIAGPGLGRLQSGRPMDAATLLRAVGRCQDEDGILNRFFPEQVGGAAFPEAETVIWRMDTTIIQDDEISVAFYGSEYWFRGLETRDGGLCEIEWPKG